MPTQCQCLHRRASGEHRLQLAANRRSRTRQSRPRPIEAVASGPTPTRCLTPAARRSRASRSRRAGPCGTTRSTSPGTAARRCGRRDAGPARSRRRRRPSRSSRRSRRPRATSCGICAPIESGMFRAPGMWPATGSRPSASPRKRSAGRASTSTRLGSPSRSRISSVVIVSSVALSRREDGRLDRLLAPSQRAEPDPEPSVEHRRLHRGRSGAAATRASPRRPSCPRRRRRRACPAPMPARPAAAANCSADGSG